MAPPTKTSIMLVTGEYFDHLAPDPSVINLDVLAHGLQAQRFNNQTIRPISIAEHSLRVRRIVRELGGDDAAQLWAANHDDHEALVPWGDCLGPGKTPEMKQIEATVDEAVIEALGIAAVREVRDDENAWSQIIDIVKTADAIALYFEAMLWQPGAIDWAPDVIFELMPALAEYLPHVIPTLAQASLARAVMRATVADRFMPLIAARPGECWRTDVEALLGARS